jgi:hypothetical protein
MLLALTTPPTLSRLVDTDVETTAIDVSSDTWCPVSVPIDEERLGGVGGRPWPPSHSSSDAFNNFLRVFFAESSGITSLGLKTEDWLRVFLFSTLHSTLAPDFWTTWNLWTSPPKLRALAGGISGRGRLWRWPAVLLLSFLCCPGTTLRL